MTDRSTARRALVIAGLISAPGFGPAAHAGGKHHAQQFVPIYVQQAPTTYVQQAPAVTTYVQQAPAVYSAPAPVYSAPAATAATAGSAPVGNAPAAGARIKDVDREDILEELRIDMNGKTITGKPRDRRKALRESAKEKYAEAIGVEATDLNEAELQDIEAVVSYLLDPERKAGAGAARLAPVGYTTTLAPATVATQVPALIPMQAPALVPMQATTLVQPMVPVQLFVPVQSKHNLFHHK